MRKVRSRWNLWLVGTAILSGCLVMALLASQDRDRLIVGSYETIGSFAPSGTDGFQFLTHSSLAAAPSFSADVACLTQFDRSHPLQPGDPLPVIDDPDTCVARLEHGYRMHCYNVDIATTAILARRGAPARLWDFKGSNSLSGDGHNLLEVFDGASHRWLALDPYYHCYFTLGDSVPMSASALRYALLTAPGRVHLVRYSDTTGERPSDAIIGELTFLAPGAMVHQNNDFAWRYDHRYGILTGIAARLIDGLPLREARGIRTVMLGSEDRLLVLEDHFSPRFPFVAMKLAFYSAFVFFLASILLLLAGLPNFRRVNASSEHSHASQVAMRYSHHS